MRRTREKTHDNGATAVVYKSKLTEPIFYLLQFVAANTIKLYTEEFKLKITKPCL